MTWTRYAKMLVLTAMGLGAALYLWVLLIDPYDIVPFSIPYERKTITGNRRFATPPLARSDRFDSFVLGTSTARNVRPSQLNTLLKASFVNLALDSGTPYEQQQLMKVFVHHHSRIRYAIIAVDHQIWCVLDAPYKKFFPQITFPGWMYDENRWNDLLYLFNRTTLEMGWRQFGDMLGFRRSKYGRDGYHRFPAVSERYDLETARRHLYGDQAPHISPPIDPPQRVPAETRTGWKMPTLERLREMLASLPAETTKILLLPPRHHTAIPVPGSLEDVRANECKRRLGAMATGVPNTIVLDFMFRSEITLADGNFWDSVHYTEDVATVVGESVKTGVTRNEGNPDLFVLLGENGPLSNAVEATSSSTIGKPR